MQESVYGSMKWSSFRRSYLLTDGQTVYAQGVLLYYGYTYDHVPESGEVRALLTKWSLPRKPSYYQSWNVGQIPKRVVSLSDQVVSAFFRKKSIYLQYFCEVYVIEDMSPRVLYEVLRVNSAF